MNVPMVTGFYAGILTVMLLLLTINIIRLRFQYRVGLGDGGEPALIKAIRMHGNFIEYIPFALMLMVIAELTHGATWWLHAAGMCLVFGRVSHAIGLTKTSGTSIYRQVGMLSVFLVLLALASVNMVSFLGF